MEELFKITPITAGEVQVSLHALQSPNNVKKLLESCAVDSVDSIVFQFMPGIAPDFLLLQAMAFLHKNGKKVSIDGETEQSDVMNQILQKIII